MTMMTNRDKLKRRCNRQEIHSKRRKLTTLQSEYEWRNVSLLEIKTIEKKNREKK